MEKMMDDLYDRVERLEEVTEAMAEVVKTGPNREEVASIAALVGVLIGVLREKHVMTPEEAEQTFGAAGMLASGTRAAEHFDLAKKAANAIKGDPVDE